MTGKPLGGKNALVTGAARRIGRAIAKGLASQGANIALHYRKAEREAESLCRELKKYNVECWLLQADFQNRDGYEGLIDAAYDKTGSLDILVNSASIFPQSSLQDITWEDLAANIQINAWAPFYISRSFAQRAGAGVIVNLLDARIGDLDLKHVAYLLSKQMLETFTRLLAMELAPRFRVNGVAPGLILPPPGKDDRYLEQLIPSIPLKRSGTVESIADAVLFLIMNDYITGQVIYVDGGRHATR